VLWSSTGKFINSLKNHQCLLKISMVFHNRHLFHLYILYFYRIMSILNHLMNAGVRVWTIKDNYRLGDNIQSKVLAFAFGLSAEIERDLISQRIKEVLARRKSEGAILGRPLVCTYFSIIPYIRPIFS